MVIFKVVDVKTEKVFGLFHTYDDGEAFAAETGLDRELDKDIGVIAYDSITDEEI